MKTLAVFATVARSLGDELRRAKRQQLTDAEVRRARSALIQLRQLAAGDSFWQREVEALDRELVGIPIFGLVRKSLRPARYDPALRRIASWESHS